MRSIGNVTTGRPELTTASRAERTPDPSAYFEFHLPGLLRVPSADRAPVLCVAVVRGGLRKAAAGRRVRIQYPNGAVASVSRERFRPVAVAGGRGQDLVRVVRLCVLSMTMRDCGVMNARSGRSSGLGGAGPAVVGPDGGLSSAEAAARLVRYGPNELPRARRTRLWQMILGQVRDPLVVVLLVAAVLTLATGDWTDAGVILLVIVVNTAAGLTQEVKAGQAIAALSELTAPEARVLRDGEQRAIPAAEVVAGDLLVLPRAISCPRTARLWRPQHCS